MEINKSISFGDLKRIFNGRLFTKRLSQAANETLKYWDETQFNVARTLDGKIIYGDVVAKSDVLDKPWSSAGGFFLDGIERLFEENGLDHVIGNVFPLVVYHTHPPKSSSHPSLNDLLDMADLRLCNYDKKVSYRYDNRPLFVIGSVLEKNRLDLLVLQEKLDRPMGACQELIPEQIMDSIETYNIYNSDDNSIIAGLLGSRPELNAALLYYEKNGNCQYRICKGELAKLEKFSYSLKILDF